MARIHCEIVTAERTVLQDDVDMVVAPGIEGQIGILPHHAPLVTSLTYGELIIHREGSEDEFIASQPDLAVAKPRFEKLDTNHDGYLSREEFINIGRKTK